MYLCLQYFEKIAERIMDTGVSVRKRVIKIIRDVCMSNSGFSKATDGCVRIISRINDEETSIQVPKTPVSIVYARVTLSHSSLSIYFCALSEQITSPKFLVHSRRLGVVASKLSLWYVEFWSSIICNLEVW